MITRSIYATAFENQIDPVKFKNFIEQGGFHDVLQPLTIKLQYDLVQRFFVEVEPRLSRDEYCSAFGIEPWW